MNIELLKKTYKIWDAMRYPGQAENFLVAVEGRQAFYNGNVMNIEDAFMEISGRLAESLEGKSYREQTFLTGRRYGKVEDAFNEKEDDIVFDTNIARLLIAIKIAHQDGKCHILQYDNDGGILGEVSEDYLQDFLDSQA